MSSGALQREAIVRGARLRRFLLGMVRLGAQVLLFFFLSAMLLALIQWVGPYEQVARGDAPALPVKVIKVDENGRLYVVWCCRSKEFVGAQDQYVAALERGHGVLVSGNSHSRYELDVTSAHEATIILHNSGDVFVYQIRDGQIIPVQRKVPDAWKIIVSLAASFLLVALLSHWADRIYAKCSIRFVRQESGG